MTRQLSKLAGNRTLCSWDLDPKRSDARKVQLEQTLKLLPGVSWKRVKGVEDSDFLPCDLAVVYAFHLDQVALEDWLQSFEKRWRKQGAIWIPALVVSPVPAQELVQVMDRVWESNWYFDIIHPDHLASLPIRVANLLRIHDHLHELQRYERELVRMQDNIQIIENELDALKLQEIKRRDPV